jgi:flagellar hook-associated protein 2
MGTVTFSGFNNIDWSSVLNAVMAQERQPVTALESQRSALKSQQTAFATLATKLSTLESAVSDLARTSAFDGRTGSSTNSAAVSIDPGTAAPGSYDVVVTELARAQTTASTSTAPDADQTAVATGGSIIINGRSISVTVPTSLQALADAINSTDDIEVVASVVSTAPGQYQLVLTGRTTGAENAFTIDNRLTGGDAPVAFKDTDGDGISGDTTGPAGDNAVDATNALATVNNVPVSSASNRLENVIPGASVTLLRRDPATTVTLSITQDLTTTKTLLQSFVTAFNDLTTFSKEQSAAFLKGDKASIGNDGTLRGLRSQLRAGVSGQYETGDAYEYLSQIGLEFDQAGMLSLKTATFDAAVASDQAAVQKLVSSAAGAFATLQSHIEAYTDEGGLLPNAKDRIDAQLTSLGKRIDAMEERLAIRRNTLAREYAATDQTMTALNASVSSLSALGNQYRLY